MVNIFIASKLSLENS